MPRRRRLTSSLYRAARLSNDARAVSRGPGAYARRVVRRKAYGKHMGLTGRVLRTLGLNGNDPAVARSDLRTVQTQANLWASSSASGHMRGLSWVV
jgi:hypothetical protein